MIGRNQKKIAEFLSQQSPKIEPKEQKLLDGTQKEIIERNILDNKIEQDEKLKEQVITKLNLFFGGNVIFSVNSKSYMIEFPYALSFDAINNYMDVLKKIGLTTDRAPCTFYISGYRLGTYGIYKYPRDSNYLMIRNTLEEILEKFNNAVDEVSLNDKQRYALDPRRGIRREHLIGKSWFNSDDHVYALRYLINDMTVDDALTKIKDLSPAQLENIEGEPVLMHHSSKNYNS